MMTLALYIDRERRVLLGSVLCAQSSAIHILMHIGVTYTIIKVYIEMP